MLKPADKGCIFTLHDAINRGNALGPNLDANCTKHLILFLVEIYDQGKLVNSSHTLTVGFQFKFVVCRCLRGGLPSRRDY